MQFTRVLWPNPTLLAALNKPQKSHTQAIFLLDHKVNNPWLYFGQKYFVQWKNQKEYSSNNKTKIRAKIVI